MVNFLETISLSANVKNRELLTRSFGATIFSLMLASCGTPSAKNFHGSWKPVNKFQETPTEIPLNAAYTYYASPLDGTLKAMLTRWSKDTGIPLAYQISSDYTLITPVSAIHTSDITAAASQLSSIYAAEGFVVSANAQQIRVEIATATKTAAAATSAATPHKKQ